MNTSQRDASRSDMSDDLDERVEALWDGDTSQRDASLRDIERSSASRSDIRRRWYLATPACTALPRTQEFAQFYRHASLESLGTFGKCCNAFLGGDCYGTTFRVELCGVFHPCARCGVQNCTACYGAAGCNLCDSLVYCALDLALADHQSWTPCAPYPTEFPL